MNPIGSARSCQNSLGQPLKRLLSIENRAPSGPVKVSVPTQPQERPQGGVSLTSGVAALFAWFPASWASKIAPCFLSQGGAPQDPQEVTIPCPTREAPGMQRAQRDRALQAVRFVDKKAPGICTASPVNDPAEKPHTSSGTISDLPDCCNPFRVCGFTWASRIVAARRSRTARVSSNLGLTNWFGRKFIHTSSGKELIDGWSS